MNPTQQDLLNLNNEEILTQSDILFPNDGNKFYESLSSLDNEKALNLFIKLRKEIRKGDSFLTFEKGVYVRNMSILILNVYFNDNDYPIKEVLRITSSGEHEKVRDNFISEKCNPTNFINDKRAEIIRTINEELNISITEENPVRILNGKQSEEVEIKNKTTYAFLKTRTLSYSASVLLNNSVNEISNRIILDQYPDLIIFYTKEMEDGVFKRYNIWWVSNEPDVHPIIEMLEFYSSNLGRTLFDQLNFFEAIKEINFLQEEAKNSGMSIFDYLNEMNDLDLNESVQLLLREANVSGKTLFEYLYFLGYRE